MGIPYYFSYIIKKYKNIITPFLQDNQHNKKENKVHNFFLDSNSIIYDVVNTMKNDFSQSVQLLEPKNIHSIIIEKVILRLESYIDLIQPTDLVFIAFDGTPPLSKLEQQRTRRYKSMISNNVKTKIKNICSSHSIHNNDNKQPFFFDTIHITAGTPFMNELSKKLKCYFQTQSKYKDIVLFSGNIPVKEPLKFWSENLYIYYYSKFFHIKSVRPKYALSTFNGKTILTIKRQQRIENSFYVYKIVEFKNTKVEEPNYIFTLVRIHK
jgi:hypothetical protein